MGLCGTIDSSVYGGLWDVLQRHPVVTTVSYEPDRVVKKFIRAQVDPVRVVPPTGPESPTLDVEWRFTTDDQYYRIHYADPKTGFNCGWHRDDDHPELGPVHFQYENPPRSDTDYQRAQFDNEVPTEVLWDALDRLFQERLPELNDSQT